MSRANIPEEQRKDFTLYVDEFQNFATDSFATILSEARKYRLNLIVANQFISQLTDEIRDAVFGNVGSVITFRTGATDADFLVKQFNPVFDTDDLVKLPNFQTVVRLMVNNVPSQPFSMATLPPLGHNNPQLGDALKRLSAAKFGRSKKVVEEEIFKRLETKTPARAQFGTGKRPSALAGPNKTPARRPGQPGSFLDDWLAKRKQRVAKPGTPKPPTAAPPTSPPAASTPAGPGRLNENVAKDIDKLFDKAPAPKPAAPPKSPQPATKNSKHEATFHIPKDDKPKSPAPKNATVSGEASDRQHIDDVSKILKKDLKAQQAAAPEKPTPESMMGDSDDMYIDKDGNIHYRSS